MGIDKQSKWQGKAKKMGKKNREALQLEKTECYYDSKKMIISYLDRSVQLSANEGDMISALIEGHADKEEIIRRVWGSRGLVVSDSSYYKTLHDLRSHFFEIGIPRSALKTLPRRGLKLICKVSLLPLSPIKSNERHDETESESQSPQHLSTPAQIEVEPVESAKIIRQAELANLLEPPQQPTIEFDNSQALSMTESAPAIPDTEKQLNKKFTNNPLRTFSFFTTLVLGLLSPIIYFYLLLLDPPDLEEWKKIHSTSDSTLYTETSEKLTFDQINSALSFFQTPLLNSSVNYYVRKPTTQLLIKCEKPESTGEAICENYIIVGKKQQ